VAGNSTLFLLCDILSITGGGSFRFAGHSHGVAEYRPITPQHHQNSVLTISSLATSLSCLTEIANFGSWEWVSRYGTNKNRKLQPTKRGFDVCQTSRRDAVHRYKSKSAFVCLTKVICGLCFRLLVPRRRILFQIKGQRNRKAH
jgi:hypothetical protein